MPVRSGSVPARFPEDLIEMEENRAADQLLDGGDDVGREGHGAEQRAMRRNRAELRIAAFAMRLAVTLGGDIAQRPAF